MKLTKGIQFNKAYKDFEEGEIAWAKNIVYNEKVSSVVNENGFLINVNVFQKLKEVLTTPEINTLNLKGFIEINPNKVVLILGSNDYEAFVLYDLDSTVATNLIIKTFANSFKLSTPTTGTFFVDNRNRNIIVFSDNVLPPFYLVLDETDLSTGTPLDLDKYYLFQNSSGIQVFSTTITNNGSLKSGNYIIFGNYEAEDGSLTNYNQLTTPINIGDSAALAERTGGSKSGIITNKSITINFQNLDTSYKYLNLYAIKTVNGVLETYFINKYLISNSATAITYTGTEIEQKIAKDLLLNNYISYDRIKEFEIINNSLTGANVSKNINYIDYANTSNIIVNHGVSFLTTNSNSTDGLNTTTLGFNEPYAIYIAYLMKDGTYTPAYHIPGPLISAPNLAIDPSYNWYKYVIEDTCVVNGALSGWYNLNESYTGEYATFFGNTNVRHFKTPSLNFVLNNATSYDSTVTDTTQLMINRIPRLYFTFSGITNPDPDRIVGFQIYYAKKDFSNILNIGTGDYWKACEMGGRPIEEIFSVGGNYEIDTNNDGLKDFFFPINAENQKTFFFNSPTTQTVKPFISTEGENYVVKKEFRLNANNNLRKLGSVNNSDRFRAYGGYLDISYNNFTSITTEYQELDQIGYVPANSSFSISDRKIRNESGGDQVVFKTKNNSWQPTTGDTVFFSSSLTDYFDTPHNVCSIIRKTNNAYTGFESQPLVAISRPYLFSEGFSIYISEYGDQYINRFNYTASIAHYLQLAGLDQEDIKRDWGVRINKQYYTISPINFNGIYEDKTKLGGFIYTNTPSEQCKLGLIYPISEFDAVTNYRWDNNGNQYIYNPDYSVKGSLISKVFPFELNSNFLTDYPYRVVQFNPIQKEGSVSGFRTLLANNYFDIDKRKGEIIKLVAQGSERLLIHTTESLFGTRSYGQIETGITTATIGTGSLFAFPPEELYSNKYGIAGLTQNNYYSAIQTPFGYFFLDAKNQIPYLTTNKPEPIYQEMFTFFRDKVTKNSKSLAGYDKQNRRILLTLDVKGDKTENYTFSYYPEQQQWKSAHDYFPTCYINSKDYLICIDTQSNRNAIIDGVIIQGSPNVNIFYINRDVNNKGLFTKSTPFNSFIDFVITSPITKILNSIQWNSENNIDVISVRNSSQHTGEINLQLIPSFATFQNSRTVERKTNFNKLRDNTITTPFIYNVDQDFNPIISAISNQTWFKTKLLIDNYFIIRFKINNTISREVIITDIYINNQDSFR